jgi:hypothetical protein
MSEKAGKPTAPPSLHHHLSVQGVELWSLFRVARFCMVRQLPNSHLAGRAQQEAGVVQPNLLTSHDAVPYQRTRPAARVRKPENARNSALFH